MFKSLTSRALLATTLITVVGALAPATAMAREGAQSVGKGLKCYTMAVKQPDGPHSQVRLFDGLDLQHVPQARVATARQHLAIGGLHGRAAVMRLHHEPGRAGLRHRL
jgi:hypothetical protein